VGGVFYNGRSHLLLQSTWMWRGELYVAVLYIEYTYEWVKRTTNKQDLQCVCWLESRVGQAVEVDSCVAGSRPCEGREGGVCVQSWILGIYADHACEMWE